MLFAASMDGQGAIAIQASKDFAKLTGNNMYRLATLIRFGRFDEVLELTDQPEAVIAGGFWDFAQGYAKLRLGEPDFARAHLNRLCDYEQRQRAIPIPVSKIRGDALDRFKTYLGDLARIPFPSQGNEWAEIQQYVQLRHRIVHNDGKIPLGQRDLQKYADRRGLVKGQGVDKGKIYLTRDFCNEVLRTVSEFLNQLHSAGQQLEDERPGAVE